MIHVIEDSCPARSGFQIAWRAQIRDAPVCAGLRIYANGARDGSGLDLGCVHAGQNGPDPQLVGRLELRVQDCFWIACTKGHAVLHPMPVGGIPSYSHSPTPCAPCEPPHCKLRADACLGPIGRACTTRPALPKAEGVFARQMSPQSALRLSPIAVKRTGVLREWCHEKSGIGSDRPGRVASTPAIAGHVRRQ
jgi:hypothetical protein